jgi:hypothetical protein
VAGRGIGEWTSFPSFMPQGSDEGSRGHTWSRDEYFGQEESGDEHLVAEGQVSEDVCMKLKMRRNAWDLLVIVLALGCLSRARAASNDGRLLQYYALNNEICCSRIYSSQGYLDH